jgi:hemolysin activation/secretion protein
MRMGLEYLPAREPGDFGLGALVLPLTGIERGRGRAKPLRRLAALLIPLAPIAVAGAAAAQSSPPAAPAASRAPATHFDINAFQVKGSTLLTDGEIERAVYPHEGPDRTPADVEAARAALQAVYEKRGFATVTVFIPEQGVESGVIRLEVNEQPIGRVTVSGAKGAAAAAVLKQAPSLASGTVPNFQAVQQNLVAMNQDPARKVTPEVVAGAAPGTVDVNLKVQESSPFHGSVEYNNYNSVDTTPTRLALSLRDDDLWGRGDSFSLTAQTAPQQTKDGTVFSANYLLRLPDNLQLLAYALHTNSNIDVVGGTTVVGKGTQAGMRLIVPLTTSAIFYQAFTFGMDWKDFQENDTLGVTSTPAPVDYAPVLLSWRGDLTLKTIKAYFQASAVYGTDIGDDRLAFQNKRFDARPDFFAFKPEAGVTADIPFGMQTFAKLTGQFSMDELVPSEQFSLGGMDTVRGYYESETLGDYGVAGQTELRSPSFAHLIGPWAQEARLHLFFDVGYAGIHEPLAGQVGTYTLYSTGVGLRFKFIKHLNGDIDLATPLVSGPNTRAGSEAVRARIWGDF